MWDFSKITGAYAGIRVYQILLEFCRINDGIAGALEDNQQIVTNLAR